MKKETFGVGPEDKTTVSVALKPSIHGKLQRISKDGGIQIGDLMEAMVEFWEIDRFVYDPNWCARFKALQTMVAVSSGTKSWELTLATIKTVANLPYDEKEGELVPEPEDVPDEYPA